MIKDDILVINVYDKIEKASDIVEQATRIGRYDKVASR
jgi:hypothetical protein